MSIDYADVIMLYPDAVLVLPDVSDPTVKGEVIAISPHTANCMVGDVILFSITPEVEVEVNLVTHRLIKGVNIVGWTHRVERPEVTYP